MKTGRNILIAFILNLSFSLFELLGGLFTRSVAILSDAVHDFGDAVSIGLSYLLEKKSHREADDSHPGGYGRYSVLGGLITTVILVVGSAIMIGQAVARIIEPVAVDYQGMIWLAGIGVVVNGVAAYVTREGDSINQKSVNLHMLEDVLGWVVVLAGAVLMQVTDIAILDSLMSIGVAVFILCHALKNLVPVLNLFLEKTPSDVELPQLRQRLLALEGVENVRDLRVRSMDGYHHAATLRVATHTADLPGLKEMIRRELAAEHITEAVIETEAEL